MDKIEKVIQWLKKKKKKHQEECDFGGFPVCSITEQQKTRVAPREEWMGNDEAYEEALMRQEESDRNPHCDYCSLGDDILKKLEE